MWNADTPLLALRKAEKCLSGNSSSSGSCSGSSSSGSGHTSRESSRHGSDAEAHRPARLACKVINKRRLVGLSAAVDIDAVLSQLRKEIAILRTCDHRNIVHFQDFVETRDAMYLVTEYAQGTHCEE